MFKKYGSLFALHRKEYSDECGLLGRLYSLNGNNKKGYTDFWVYIILL
jgi:hypothetical protein